MDFWEFRTGLRKMGLALSAIEARALFATLDSDHSGAIEPTELEQLLFGRTLTNAQRAELHAAARRDVRHRHEQGALAVMTPQEGRKDQGASGLLRLLPYYLIGGSDTAQAGGAR